MIDKMSARWVGCVGRSMRTALLALCLLGAASGAAWAQEEGLDLCGCRDLESLGDFDSRLISSFPPGTVYTGTSPRLVTIPVPDDGILVFDSFYLGQSSSSELKRNHVFFTSPNQNNTPVRILVKDFVNIIAGADNGIATIDVSGNAGTAGVGGRAGQGGAPGPGGYAGGDGAFLAGNLTDHGGAGIGPGGGNGGRRDPVLGGLGTEGGTFFGVSELRPLVGGSGGGGGYSEEDEDFCAGGGGGGGGGALQIVANGTITIGGRIYAQGGDGGSQANPECAGPGGGGSGGAILLIADTITGGGSDETDVSAAGGGGGVEGGNGRIRMEAITNSFTGQTTPVALQVGAPGPAVAAATPTVAITQVAGAVTPQPPDYPQGFNGEIDMIVEEPGDVTFSFETHEVPSGTVLAVAVKPVVGGDPITREVTLDACGAGMCTKQLTVNLDPGAYIAEARATFEVREVPEVP